MSAAAGLAPVPQPSDRVMVMWCPDWPVLAAANEKDLDINAPVAVIAKGVVHACSEVARQEGVRRGMRRRDASARCPTLELVDHSEERDCRYFSSVLSAIERVSATVSPIRPGTCALGVPSRFYGGEQEAAAVVAEALVEAGVWDCRAGISDGIFAAEQAARQASRQGCLVVPSGQVPAFLADLPIDVLDQPDMVSLLRRLGVRRLGDFAALSPRDVLTRFGTIGAHWHRLARGEDLRRATPRQPPIDLTRQVCFEPPLPTMEPIVFSSRQMAGEWVAGLAHHGLVCTMVTVTVTGDRGWTGQRTWSHSRWFSATDVIDRLYWQLQADPPPEPVAEVTFRPEVVESLADHGEGLWGSASDERIERGAARLQGLLGPEAVLAPSLQGGRTAQARQALTPWGEAPAALRTMALPWPGAIPPPAPSRVFRSPVPALVEGPDGQRVAVTERGLLTASPARFSPQRRGPLLRVQAWAGPWPIDELWWDPLCARRVARFQIVGADGSAWLMVVEDGQWWSEARYD
jgi:protein ImuB